jgi:HK97 family phage major capsid protein
MKLTQAELERKIEGRLKAAHDARSNPNINVRPGTQDAEPTGLATRGNPGYQRTAPEMTPEEAQHVMGFFRGVMQGDSAEVRRSVAALQRDPQSVAVNADGGYTVPYQFLTEVTVVLPTITPFADSSLIRIIPMESETTRWTKVITKPAAPGMITEGSAYSKSKVTFGLVELVARKVGQIIPLTAEIMQSNQVGMVSLIAELVGEQLAYKRNALVTAGSGVGEPEGVMTNGDVANFSWDNTSEVTIADSVIGMFHSLASQYRRDAFWMFNNASIAGIRKLKDSQKRYLWTDGFGSTPATLLGKPVFENPDLSNAQALFGSFKRGYALGIRNGLEVERNSSGTDWEKDITNFKFRERYDGKVNDASAFVKTTTLDVTP